MRTIWKFPLKIQDIQNIVGHGACVISAALDPAGDLCVWAFVDDEKPVVVAEIAIRGTGHPLPPEIFAFVNTVRCGNFMWHVFVNHGDLHSERANIVMTHQNIPGIRT